jgi:glyoxylase-like metal-dependent hydrolase (beta-lactamase superfamily II)
MTRIELAGYDIVGIRADNPGPFTLAGTNSWVLGRDPAWLVDPGPALDQHVEALTAEIAGRGGLGGIALTHDHPDHSESVPAIIERFPGTRLGAARWNADMRLSNASVFGPLEAVSTPGHSPDHLSFVIGGAAFTGDAVLGVGSVFISPYPGALSAYLRGLERLRRVPLEVLLPGHGPPVHDPMAKLDEYISHRLEREHRLLAALANGGRTVDELLDEVWDDAPAMLRPAAAWTLAAHLDKLDAEGRLPQGVERPKMRA